MPSFVEISPPVPEKKILKGFTIYGHGCHLGHVTNIIFMIFFPCTLKLTYKIWLKTAQSFLRKAYINFHTEMP